MAEMTPDQQASYARWSPSTQAEFDKAPWTPEQWAEYKRVDRILTELAEKQKTRPPATPEEEAAFQEWFKNLPELGPPPGQGGGTTVMFIPKRTPPAPEERKK